MNKFIIVLMLILIFVITGCGGTGGPTNIPAATPSPTGEPGTIQWTFPSSSGAFIGSNPAIGVDGTIYAGNSDGKLYAINPDGSLKWSYTTGFAINTSPVIGNDGTVYIGSGDGCLYAVSNGTLDWFYYTGGKISCTPVIGVDATIYIGSDNNTIHAIKYQDEISASGSITTKSVAEKSVTSKWQFTTDAPVTVLAIGPNGMIYAGTQNSTLYAIYPYGKEYWQKVLTGTINYGLAIDSSGNIYAGTSTGNFYVLTNTGYIFGSAAKGAEMGCPVIGKDGTVYIASITQSELYAFSPSNATTTNWPQEWSMDVSGGGSFSFARLTVGKDGLLYVGTGYSLLTVDPSGPTKATLVGGFGNNVSSELAIGTGGMVYFCTSMKIFAVNSSCGGLADSSWPMFQQNVMHTGGAHK